MVDAVIHGAIATLITITFPWTDVSTIQMQQIQAFNQNAYSTEGALEMKSSRIQLMRTNHEDSRVIESENPMTFLHEDYKLKTDQSI